MFNGWYVPEVTSERAPVSFKTGFCRRWLSGVAGLPSLLLLATEVSRLFGADLWPEWLRPIIVTSKRGETAKKTFDFDTPSLWQRKKKTKFVNKLLRLERLISDRWQKIWKLYEGDRQATNNTPFNFWKIYHCKQSLFYCFQSVRGKKKRPNLLWH